MQDHLTVPRGPGASVQPPWRRRRHLGDRRGAALERNEGRVLGLWSHTWPRVWVVSWAPAHIDDRKGHVAFGTPLVLAAPLSLLPGDGLLQLRSFEHAAGGSPADLEGPV